MAVPQSDDLIILVRPHPQLMDKNFDDGISLLIYSTQIYPPLGLSYLASSLQKENFKVKIVDFCTPAVSLSELAQIAKEKNVKIIGIYTVSFDLFAVGQLIRMIKSWGDITVVVGGPHITHHPQSVRLLGADYGIRGDGERSMVLLARYILHQQGCLEDIPGIVYQESGELIIKEKTIIRDLDNLPFPDFSTLDIRHYKFLMLAGKVATMISSRGCPFDCIFCGITQKKTFLVRSPENVVEEMRSLAQAGYRYVDFRDDCLCFNKERIKTICRMLIKDKISISWGCETRVDSVDDELLSLMARASCHNVRFGIESTVPRVAQIIGKKVKLDSLDKILKTLRKLKIVSVGFFLIGHPTETLQDIKETLKFAVSSRLDCIEINLVVPIPGSRLFDIAKAEGIVDDDVWEKAIAGEKIPTYIPQGLSFSQLELLKKNAMLRFYFKPKTIFRFARGIHSVSDLGVQLQTAKELIKYNMSRRRS